MERSFFMNAILGRTALALAIVMATLPANAKGCIKGAIVGGAAGHVAGHHGLMERPRDASLVITRPRKTRRRRKPRIELGGCRLGVVPCPARVLRPASRRHGPPRKRVPALSSGTPRPRARLCVL